MLSGPDDEVDVPHPREQRLALLLRDAAGDGDDEVGPRALERRELADLAAELLLGLLAHAARVEDDEVRVLRRSTRDVPPARAQDFRPCGRSRARSSGSRTCE